MREDYTWRLLSRPTEDGKGLYKIELIPKPNAPVIWGKVLVNIDAQKRPKNLSYWNERGVLIREMSFHDYQKVKTYDVPRRMRVTPKKKPGEFTEIIYEQLDFDVDLSPRLFSLQALKR